MPTTLNPQGRPIELPLQNPGPLRRLGSRIKGAASAWFGPGNPDLPTAPAHSERAFDYPLGWNTGIQRREYQTGISFDQLRALADMHDLTRLAIETRKDQMGRLDWLVRTRESRETLTSADPIIKLFENPDHEHSWDVWLRMLLEDVFVIDAPAIEPRFNRDGSPYSLDLIDGTTIQRLIDGTGRTPFPPSPAYLQIIKGVVAAQFSRDELIYFPRTPRIHKFYGMSPVEQIMVTVNIALRRQKFQLDYYTDGNIPDALSSVPETWGMDEIERFQKYWDTVLEAGGSQEQRRKIKFIPHGADYIPTKDPKLFDDHDEWLARIVCYAFSLPPTPFIKQMNRATAETADIEGAEEGIEPFKLYISDLMNRILTVYWKRPDLEFAWAIELSKDRKTQAEIHDLYVAASVMTPNEVRSQIGLGPLPGGDKLMRDFEAENQMELTRSKQKRGTADPQRQT